MRRRFRRDILVTKPPPEIRSEKKVFKYSTKLTPFNIWFRSQLKLTGGLKTFCHATKIPYNTARCWTYKTTPQINYRYDIAKFFGSKFNKHHLEIVAEIENLRRKRV